MSLTRQNNKAQTYTYSSIYATKNLQEQAVMKLYTFATLKEASKNWVLNKKTHVCFSKILYYYSNSNIQLTLYAYFKKEKYIKFI